jgi:hypothetical protein
MSSTDIDDDGDNVADGDALATKFNAAYDCLQESDSDNEGSRRPHDDNDLLQAGFCAKVDQKDAVMDSRPEGSS